MERLAAASSSRCGSSRSREGSAAAPPRKARIEIIPMIDTVFFLLVFFMMASLAMTVHGGIPVNLPKAARAEAARAPVSVSISREGVIYLEREPVDAGPAHARACGPAPAPSPSWRW